MFYDELYKILRTLEREVRLLEPKKFLSTYNVKPDSKVLEIGAARGLNHLCHPNYIGIEYSYDAVRIAAERFEGKANVIQGTQPS